MGNFFPAEIVKDNKATNIVNYLKKDTKIIAIDELMIFNNHDETIEVIDYLIDKKNICVLGSGLTLDFRGEPFRPICDLLPYAKVEELYGVCEHIGKDGKRCDKDGVFPQRITKGQPAHYNAPLIQVGDNYMIKCREHHTLPGKPLSKIEKIIENKYSQ